MNKAVLPAILAVWLAAPAVAATVTIGTDQGLVSPGRDNQGWWRATGSNTNLTNDNYFTGNSDVYRSYFTFDLSGLVGETITGLQLDLRQYGLSGGVNLGFYDVGTSAAALAQRGVVNAAIHADLGTGNSYGSSGILTDRGSFHVHSFELNAQAVSDANAAIGGYFSVGARNLLSGSVFSASGDEPGNGGPGYTQNLVVTMADTATVPLPAALPLLLAALGAMGVAARRRRS